MKRTLAKDGEKRAAPPDAAGRRSEGWIVAAFFALVAALFYAPLLAGIRAFPDGDFVHHFFPFSFFQHQHLASGQLALWNPYTYSGHPFLADVQAAIFYPISNLLLLLTLPVTDAAARFYLLQVEAILHTVLAGGFMYLWARDLTSSRWGGVLGGVCFALSGYVTGYAPLQLAVLRTAVWLPLLLWCIGRGWHAPRQWRWHFGTVGALSAAFLAGHSQTFLLIGYAAAAWVICLALFSRAPRLPAMVGTALAALVAVALTAAQWLPSAEFVRFSVRAAVEYDFVSGGLVWADSWQLILPRVLTQYSPLYVGAGGIVLAVVAVFTLRASEAAALGARPMRLIAWRVGIMFNLGMFLFALLAALGGNGPLYPLLYQVAPGWAWFRGQERAAFLVALALSVLAAYGMAALPLLTAPVRRRAAFVAGAILVAMVYSFGLLWQLQGRTAIDHVGYLLIAGMTLLFGLAAAMLIATPGWSARRSAWLVALAVVNLVWANGSTNQLAGTPVDRVRIAPEVSAVVAAVQERADVANGLPGRVYNEYRAYDDYGMRSKVEDVWGSSPLRSAHYAELFTEFPLDRMWRLLGVEHILTWRRELFGPSELVAEFPQATDTTYLHRLPFAYPRAWLVPEVAVVDDATARAQLADHQFDLDRRALLGQENGNFSEVTNVPANGAEVELARHSERSLFVTVRTETDGLMVVSETWLPGWEIVDAQCSDGECPTADGGGRAYFKPMRANLTLVGIWLPAGRHTFMLRYNPLSVRLGLWISGVTLVLLLLAIGWRGRSRGQVQAS